MIRKCPVCGKQFDVLYPELWRYREGNLWICTWKCLRKIRKENEGDMYAKTKKDGTPAKKSGPRPRAAEENPQPIGGGEWEKMEAPEAKVKLDGAVRIETKEPEKVVVATVENGSEKDAGELIREKRYTVTAISYPEIGEFYYDRKFGCIDWRTNEGDEVSMSPTGWKILMDDFPEIMNVLGVEL